MLNHQDYFSIQLMCQVFQVDRSGYYAWRKKPKGFRALANEQLDQQLKEAFDRHKKRYGAPRLTYELKAQGLICSKNRIARRMKALNLQAQGKRRFKPSAQQEAALAHRVVDNVLNRDFTATAINQKYVADITYIPTAAGWLYLAVVIDIFSRAVIGWSMQSTMTQQLVIDAFLMALKKRNYPRKMIFHSDRGSQYCADAFQKMLTLYHCTISMSRRGNCWDNSVAESFFHTLKVELVHHERYTTLEEAKSNIFNYIETYYNQIRRHSSIGYIAPFAFEKQALLVA
jgi:putative transposase